MVEDERKEVNGRTIEELCHIVYVTWVVRVSTYTCPARNRNRKTRDPEHKHTMDDDPATLAGIMRSDFLSREQPLRVPIHLPRTVLLSSRASRLCNDDESTPR